jgi:hypothetical protein
MSPTISISRSLVTKDPNSIEYFIVDWTDQLATAVTIVTSTWEIAGPNALLTKDQESVVTGNKKTQLRLSAGTLHRRYTVTNRIVTNETPAQTKDASFTVLIESK